MNIERIKIFGNIVFFVYICSEAPYGAKRYFRRS